MKEKTLEDTLKLIVGSEKTACYIEERLDSEQDIEILRLFLKDFVFQHKLGGKIKIIGKGKTKDSYYIKIKCSERTAKKINKWLDQNETEYGFKETYC